MSMEIDPKMLSTRFKEQVNDAMANGAAGVADRLEDYDALAKMLAGIDHEKDPEAKTKEAYIREKMDEYVNKFKLSDLRNRAKDFTKTFVDKIKNLYTEDNQLDRDEADKIADEIADLRKADGTKYAKDIEYLCEELRAAGFGFLIPDESTGETTAAPGATTPAAPKKPVKKPSVTPVKKKPSASQEPSSATAPVQRPKYNENQKKLISDMKDMTSAILRYRDDQRMRNWKIGQAKNLLRDAKALGLENTDEYKELFSLVYPKSDVPPIYPVYQQSQSPRPPRI